MPDVASMVLGIAAMAAVPIVLVRVLFGQANLAALFASPWSERGRGVQEQDLGPFHLGRGADRGAGGGRGASILEAPSPGDGPPRTSVRCRVRRARP